MKNRLNFAYLSILIVFVSLSLILSLPTIEDIDTCHAQANSNTLSDITSLPTIEDSDTCHAQANCRTLPVIMYHQILNSVHGTYIVSEKQLQSDLNAFSAAGYTTVFPSEIIDYVSTGKPLPKKPILITFDDGYYNNYYYGKNIFQRNNAKALISVVGKFSEQSVDSHEKLNPHFSHLTWDNMKELSLSGNFEFGNHTYDMHAKSPRFGIGQMQGEDAASYKKAITADTLQLKNKLLSLGITTEVYAYPFGKYNSIARDTLSNLGYKMMLTCNEGINIITAQQPSSIQSLCRINRDGTISTSQLMHKIDHPYQINGSKLSK